MAGLNVISPFKSHISLNRLYLSLKILNMTFCCKLETRTFAEIFQPKKLLAEAFSLFSCLPLALIELSIYACLYSVVELFSEIKCSNYLILKHAYC